MTGESNVAGFAGKRRAKDVSNGASQGLGVDAFGDDGVHADAGELEPPDDRAHSVYGAAQLSARGSIAAGGPRGERGVGYDGSVQGAFQLPVFVSLKDLRVGHGEANVPEQHERHAEEEPARPAKTAMTARDRNPGHYFFSELPAVDAAAVVPTGAT